MITPRLNPLTHTQAVLPASTAKAIEAIQRIEELVLEDPQIDLTTYHVLHGGVYARTIMVPKGALITGALIKIPTTLTVCGKCSVLIGDALEVMIDGYHVFAASAGRKQAYIAHEDTWITMSFKTNATTIEEAEAEFTDEAERLMSRQGMNDVVITGE